mgnify:CR=1 FL=1
MKTLFSFEVPIAHLNDFEDLQDFHFSLSFVYDDPKYKAFMMRQASRGYKPVWLDNSYNEKLEAESSHKLVALMREVGAAKIIACLLYTSDAADDLPCVDLGGRRIIKKKNPETLSPNSLVLTLFLNEPITQFRT